MSVAAPGHSAQPSSHALVAQHDTPGLDFELCKVPKEYKHQKPGCGVVEIDGRVVDAFGASYGPFEGHQVTVSVEGDDARTDAQGRFVVFVESGPVTVTALGYGGYPTQTSAVVEANDQVNTASLTLPPTLKAVQASTTSVLVQLDGLPVTHDLNLSIDRVPASADTSCASSQSMQLFFTSASRAEPVELVPPAVFSAFCAGSYTATLAGAGVPVTTDTFTIP